MITNLASIKDFLDAVVQMSVARLLWGSSRFAISPVTSTSILLVVAWILEKFSMADVSSSAPWTWNVVTGSNENFPGPADAKSNNEATMNNHR